VVEETRVGGAQGQEDEIVLVVALHARASAQTIPGDEYNIIGQKNDHAPKLMGPHVDFMRHMVRKLLHSIELHQKEGMRGKTN